MLATQKQQVEMYQRVQDFLGANPPPSSAVYDTQKTAFDVVVAKLIEFAGEQVVGRRLSRAEVQRNKALRRELRERHLAPISQIARALLADAPGIEKALRMPSWSISSTKLVAEAHAMRTAAQAYADVFVQNGRPASFLEDLDAAAEAVRQTVLGKARNIGRSAGARKGIAQLIKQGRKSVEILDTIVRTAFVGNADVLAKWRMAKRVQGVPGGGSSIPATGGTADENLEQAPIAA